MKYVRDSLLQLLCCVDRALLAILTLALELDGTVNQSKEGVVAADTDVIAGMDVRASLTNQNVAREDELAPLSSGEGSI